MLRTLMHYWRMSLAVMAGAAVASAVLTGALLVGDSVRQSLRQLTLERLGAVDLALAGQRFFRQDLAAELASRPRLEGRVAAVAPAILLQGTAEAAATRARASRVAVQGVDGAFLDFFAGGGEVAELFAAGGGIFPPAILNQPLADALGAAVGDDLLVSFKRWSEVPRGSLLGHKDTASVVETVRLRVAGVLPDRGLGRFSLALHQGSSYNVFVPLEALARALDQEGTVNGLVVSLVPGGTGASAAADLDRLLGEILRLEDLGILVGERPVGDEGSASRILAIESRELMLKPRLAAAVGEVAAAAGAAEMPVLTYLVNELRRGDRRVPYSTVSALPQPVDPAFGPLADAEGAPVELADDEIALNEWTARELEAAVGDRVELTYFVVGPREELSEETASFTVAAVVPIAGLAADATLTQDVPGISDSDSMADWDPPFPLDLGRVRPVDEEYWDLYRGTPKAFLALDAGRRLWRNRWGELTAIRLAPGAEGAAALGESLGRDLVTRVTPAAFGLTFQPVKELGLASSGGATDFGGMFIGFSLFLIVSAAMLVGLLFSLGVEQRGPQVGLLRAVGYPAARVRRRLLAEGGILAALGSLLGLAGAVVYAGLMMAGLRTWWLPAVGTSRLELHVGAGTLALGFAISLLVVLAAIWLRLRRLRRVSTPALLARVVEPPDTRAGRRARITALIALALAGALLAFAFATGRTADPAIFGTAGPALLVGLLALFALGFGGVRPPGVRPLGVRPPGVRPPGGRGGLGGRAAVLRMAASSAARHRGRSLLAATLVAAASFLVVTVAAYQTDFSHLAFGPDSGTGGYALVGESDIPLHHDPGDRDGRFELGVGAADEAVLAGAHIVPLRLLPGDDTSCLNLYQPRQPRIAGVPAEIIEGGRFLFSKTLEETDHPWSLLDLDLGPGVVPAIGDANSMQWILKLGLGEDLVLEDEAGGELRLRLVAMIGSSTAPSLFQSELLISESSFRRHFPGHSGWSYFLIEAPGEAESELSQALERALADYGFDAVTAAEKLESFHAVQNTYLSTFRTLGGLGLLLGTVGLAIVLLRNVAERRGELAALRAFGFRRRTLTTLVVLENALLLLVGLLIGTVAALVTAAPNLLAEASSFPGRTLAVTLAGIFLFGLAASIAAAFGALRSPLMPALKAEH